MAIEGFKRKLVAIFSADVEGYSILMDQDEEGTIRTLKTFRTAMTDLVQQYRGRVVDSPGDNILAEFTSVVDAVNCAVEVQRDFAERNAAISENRRMKFRIGVNVGDVVDDMGRIYGDGVNIAARVEAIAEAGGTCITGRVYEQVANKLGLEYENLGEHQVKNISTPIRVYRVLSFPGVAAHRVIRTKNIVKKKWKIIYLSLSIVLAILASAAALWEKYFHLPSVLLIDHKGREFNLPNGPKIAVLPFKNLSGDSEQDYLSDGLTENIITGLSSCNNLFVIARDSTFIYKNQPVTPSTVAHDLGANYVVTGSVLREKNILRINAHLIETTTAKSIWANKYDRNLENIIALQDEITIEILTALNVTLLEGQQANSWIKGCTSNLEVYMKALKGLHHLRSQNKEENILARQLAKEALQIAPECSNLYVLLSHTYLMDVYFDPGSSMLSFAFATHNLKRALALDKNNHIVYISLATLYLFQNDYENAIAAGERAIILNPSGADAYNQLGLILCLSGQCEKAIEFHKKAIALNPYAPGAYFSQLGWAYYASKQHEEGIKTLEVSLKRNPLNIIAHLTLTYAYYKSGMETKARLQAIEVYKIDPDFNSETIHSWPMKNREILEEFIQTLRKTGIK